MLNPEKIMLQFNYTKIADGSNGNEDAISFRVLILPYVVLIRRSAQNLLLRE